MRQDISARIFSIMGRMSIAPSPTNYELIHEIISGNNPALRDRFMQLGSAPDAKDLARLAEEYLPHHFGQSLGDRSTTAIKSELEQLMDSLKKVQQECDAYSSVLETATQRIDTAEGDGNVIRRQLKELTDATSRQRESNSSLAVTVQQGLAAIATVSAELNEAERAKFTHAATGLNNRRSFNKRLAEKLGPGKLPEDVSLIFVQIGNFRIFEAGNLLKFKTQVLARIGATLSRIFSSDDMFVAWIDTPHIAVLVETTQRAEIDRCVELMKAALSPVLEDVRKRLPNYLPLTLSFGACDAYSAFSLSDLMDKAERALIDAEKLPYGNLVIFDSSEKSGGQRHNYSLYQGANGTGEAAS